MYYSLKKILFLLGWGVLVLTSPLFFENVHAQDSGSGNADISVSVSTPPPFLSLSSPAEDQLEVHWNWDFISAGYFPPPITEVRVEISSDGLNYGNLQIFPAPLIPPPVSSTYVVLYTGLPAGNYWAQVEILDGNDFDYIVGPVSLSSGGGRRTRTESFVNFDDFTDLTLSGLAYPGPSTVVIFTYQGGFETVIDPSSTGSFSYQISTLPVGSGTFSFSAKDPNNVLSAPVVFDYNLPANSPVVINDISLPPTIYLSSTVVTVGELMTIEGYAFRNGSVSLDIDGPSSRAYLIQVDSFGKWSVVVDSSDLASGTYNITALATSSGAGFVSPPSNTLVFELVLPLPAAPVCGDGTLDSLEQCDDGNTIPGDGCSSLCQIEADLPESMILQPSPAVFSTPTFSLDYSATSPNGTIEMIDVYYSRNGAPYVLYPASFFNGTIELSGLLDGDYEVYSIARDTTGAVEPPPLIADADFVIDQVLAFNVLAYPEKRFPAQGNWSLPAQLTLYPPGASASQYTFDFVTDQQGRADVPASSVPSAPYDFVLKGLSHLSKRLPSLSFSGADLLLDFSFGGTFHLIAGDVHPTKDDYINGLDISSAVTRLYGSFLDADLNFDGFVNGMDLSMIVINLYKKGEGT